MDSNFFTHSLFKYLRIVQIFLTIHGKFKIMFDYSCKVRINFCLSLNGQLHYAYIL